MLTDAAFGRLTATARRTVALVWFTLALGPAWAGGEVPTLTGRVVDPSALLTRVQTADMIASLEAYETETTHQIAVLITPSLDGESVDTYSLRVARAWALGHRGVDNGMLVVLAPNEKRVRIQLGRGFEPFIADARAVDIIREHMLPHFKQGRYAAGLQDGLAELMRDGRAFVVTPGR